MSEHLATTSWKRETKEFSYDKYNREHLVDFGYSTVVHFSAAGEFAGREELVDPEQAFTASLSSCRLLTFLAVASKQRFIVDKYEDEAIGIMGKNERGKFSMLEVTLSPKVKFSGEKIPTQEEFQKMHEKAHANCIIANSVSTPVKINPTIMQDDKYS